MTQHVRSDRRRRFGARLLGERGAAAVEFALVVPLLLVLLFGIIQFSVALNTQSTLSAAAREGVRAMTLRNDVAQARTAARAVAPDLGLTDAQISVAPATCSGAPSGTTVTVTVSYHEPFVYGVFGRTGVDLTGRAVMRCGG